MRERRAPRSESALHTLALGAFALVLAAAAGPQPASAAGEAITPGPAAFELRSHPLAGAPLASVASHVLHPGSVGGLEKDEMPRPASRPSRMLLDTADFDTPLPPRTSPPAHRTGLLPPRTTGPPGATS